MKNSNGDTIKIPYRAVGAIVGVLGVFVGGITTAWQAHATMVGKVSGLEAKLEAQGESMIEIKKAVKKQGENTVEAIKTLGTHVTDLTKRISKIDKAVGIHAALNARSRRHERTHDEH